MPSTNSKPSLGLAKNNIPAVVINLSRHRDRLSWFMSNAFDIGLSIERLEAVDASAPRNNEDISAFRGENSTLSTAEAACFLSHRRALQLLLNMETKYLAIFEDDAHLAIDLPTLLNFEHIPPGIELVRLEEPYGKVSLARRAISTFGGRNLHRVLTRANGAAGYIISRHCAERLLADTSICAHPVDVVLFDDNWPTFREFGVFQVVPAACVQDMNLHRLVPENKRFASEIEAGRQSIKQARRKHSSAENKQRFKKLRRYFRCVLQGASPLRYRDYVPVDLSSQERARP